MRRHFDAHGGMSSSIAGVGASTLIGAVLLFAPGSAQAAGGPQSCVTDLTAGTTQCYATNAQAEAAVAAASLGSFSTSSLAVTTASSVVIGRIYEHADYGGAVHVYTAASGCDSNADRDKSRSSMPSGWNDVVSSFRGYNGCQLKVWEHENFGGAAYGPSSAASSLGAMNDRASSVTFH